MRRGIQIFLSENRLRFVTLNCNGLRGRRQRLALERLLGALKASVRVATESHLRRWDLEILRIPGYVVASSFCRKATNKRIGGGVAILAAATPTAETVSSSRHTRP